MSNKNMRIGMLLGSVSHLSGGLFNSVRQLSLALIDAQAKIEVLAPNDHHTKNDRAAWAPIKPVNPSRVGPSSFGYAPGIGEYLANTELDVLHQHGIWQAISTQTSSWRRRTDRPVVISPRGMLDPWAIRNSRLKKKIAAQLFENTNLHGAACLHALNEAEAAAIRAYGLENPIAVIPNGVGVIDPDRGRYQRPSFLPQDEREILLFLGRLHPKKGLRELIEAFAAARMSDASFTKRWRLVIAGWDDGGFAGGLSAQAAKLGLGNTVLFPGALFGHDKEAMLHYANAFVLPSYSEGLPMAVLEAWAHRIPVLMTDACNLPESFSEGAAWRIETAPKLLAEQLSVALSSDLSGIADAGHRLAKERFSWTRIAQKHLEVYSYLNNSGPKPEGVWREYVNPNN